MVPVFLAAVLGFWTPTSSSSAETRLSLAASAVFCSPCSGALQEVCQCHGPAVLQSQTVCCTSLLAVLRENLSHNGDSATPAKMVEALPAGDVLSEGIGILQVLMIFV